MEKDRQLKPQAADERFVREAEQRRTVLQSELEAKTNEVREKFEADREDLEWLKAKQLLNETRYRELHEALAARLHAAMGAEAIYDIVAKIDLEAMAEELRRRFARRAPSSAARRPSSACRSPSRCASRATGPSG